MNASEEWLTVQQAAAVRGVYWNSIYAAVRQGRLPAEKRDGRIRIRRADLEKWQPRGSRPMQRQPAQAIQEQCAAAAARIGTAPSLTIRQAARWKGIRPEQLYQAIREGRLRAAREGASYRIFSTDLEEWLAGQRPSSVNAQAIQEQYAAAAARIGTAPSFTIRQVARWKGIRPEQLYQAIWEGRLRAAREGASYRIFSADLEEWLAEQRPSSVNAQAP